VGKEIRKEGQEKEELVIPDPSPATFTGIRTGKDDYLLFCAIDTQN